MDEFTLEFEEPGKPTDFNNLSLHKMQQLLTLMEAYEVALENMGAAKFFVPGTPFSIDNCPKHREFFRAGAEYPERLFMAGNRCGKTVSGAVEASYHATGDYPDWWEGKRFANPTNGWAAGDTSQTTRDTVQKELLGPPGAIGTGTIPKDRIIKVLAKPGIPNAIDSVLVKHVSGGVSSINFKSYEQGVKAFYGTARHWVWLDEECPEIIYNECLIRTMTTGGIVFVTFTPLHGITPFIVNFMKNAALLAGARAVVALDGEDFQDTDFYEVNTRKLMAGNHANATSGRCVIQAGWADAKWLDQDVIDRMKVNTPSHLLEARMHGYPSIGSGNVYPVPLEEITVEPFEIPKHWKRMYALDVGWNRTAALWAAIDPTDQTIYIYSEYYVGDARPELHAAAIRFHGEAIHGVIDPASRGRSQVDGQKLLDIYKRLGLKVRPAKNEVESGVYHTWNKLSNGRLKVFRTLTNFQKEYMVYRRDLTGKIVKENDHLMDCMRYIINNIECASQVLERGLANKGEGYGGRQYDI